MLLQDDWLCVRNYYMYVMCSIFDGQGFFGCDVYGICR
jgi:hypothetical protein